MSSPAFAARLLSRLGVVEKGDVVAELEVPTGDARNRIDLELRIVDGVGRLLRRAWIEVKVGSMLAGEHPASATTPARRGQLVRYRSALDIRDAVRHWLRPSPLAVLLPRVDEEHERHQIQETGATVLTWQAVGELAAHRAHEMAGADWRIKPGVPARPWN